MSSANGNKITDAHGREIKVGTRVQYGVEPVSDDERNVIGLVTEITDIDVDDSDAPYRVTLVPPYVIVRFGHDGNGEADVERLSTMPEPENARICGSWYENPDEFVCEDLLALP